MNETGPPSPGSKGVKPARSSRQSLSILRRIKRAVGAKVRKSMVRMTSLDGISTSKIVEHFPAQTVKVNDCLSMPFRPGAYHLRRASYRIPSGTSRILKGVSYCAPNNMLLTRSRRIVTESISTKKKPEAFKWEHLFLQEKEYLYGRCSSIRSLRNNFYHTLVDNLPRLFLLNHPAYADQEIKLLFPGGPTSVESFFLAKLCPPNVSITEIEPNRLYFCGEFLFADFLSRRFAGFLPQQYLEYFLPKFLPKRPRQHDKRILISRRNATNRRSILNEDELTEALLPLGFKAYVLEDMDLDSQIELFYDATMVVAPHGAGLTNLLFAEDADVIELHPNSNLFPHYYFMCESLKHRYWYWCGNEESRFSHFRVDTSAVLKLIVEAEDTQT